MEKVKYSIIIPHYNIPHLLKRALKSIPYRKDIQVIVVDNNSSPENRASARAVCHEFSHVEYIQDEIGHGAGHARNVGMKYIKGEWMIVLAADDFFYVPFWDKLDDYIKDTSADVIYFRAICVDSDTLESAEREVCRWDTLIHNFIEKKKNADYELRFLCIGDASKLYRFSFIQKENILFDETKTANDVMFCIQTGHKAKKIEAYDEIMYVVTKRTGSLVTLQDRESLRCRYEVRLRRNRYLKTIGMTRYCSSFPSYFVRAMKNGGIKELGWYFKKMIEYRINPFWGYGRVLHNKLNGRL